MDRPAKSERGQDPAVEVEFSGSLTLCEDGSIRPTVNSITGAVVDKFGVYRAEEDDYYDRYEQ